VLDLLFDDDFMFPDAESGEEECEQDDSNA